MKKGAIYFLLIISIFLCTLSVPNYVKSNNFRSSNVEERIAYLSSDSFDGRLGGTIENAMAANYIKNQFKEIGLEPLDGNYYQSFETNCPVLLEDSPLLAVVDSNNKIVKTYEYGVNYKESLLNFRINEINFNQSEVHSKNTNSLYVLNSEDNSKVIFFTSIDNSLKFRSSFFDNSEGDLYINVTKETLADINLYLDDGYSIYTYIPYEVQEKTLNNVVGLLKGKNSSLPPLVLSAHFDHVGTDLNGTIYSGALDNASGTSFLIELAKYIKNLGTPDRDIIFAAFNAEELGLKGSAAFAEKYADKLNGSEVYNFDMIGSFDGIPLCIMSGSNNTAQSPLVNELATVMKDNKIYFNYLFQDASDHVPFIERKIEAVTLCDNDTSRIHTPNDRIEYISEDAISRCFSVIKIFILNHAYSENFIYSNLTSLIILSIISIIISSALIINLKIKKKNLKVKER